MSPRCL